ncbi:MAG: uracil-DNA glycosylase [Spirochaetaceae bacterium]|nr:uracil-DNA glycosylase [Spirochaetaceae bacterium]
MTPDQRFYRFLTLIEDYYAGGERSVDHPPPVRFPRPITEPEPEPERSAAPGRGDSLDAVAREIAACRACALCEGRTRTVPGEGAAQPLVLVIGEGPGFDEDRSGRPFVGRAGAYLDRWLEAIELRRADNCFITNVVKCRPPQNRDPASAESQACLPFLQRQIRLLEPRAILSVGRIAGQLLTGQTATMAALRVHTHSYRIPGLPEPVPLVATYHPSGVLRNQSLRRAVWDDLRRLQKLLADGGTPPAAGAR